MINNASRRVRRLQEEGRSMEDIANHILRERNKRWRKFALIGAVGLALLGGGMHAWKNQEKPSVLVEAAKRPSGPEPVKDPYADIPVYKGITDPKRAWVMETEKPEAYDSSGFEEYRKSNYPLRGVRLDANHLLVVHAEKMKTETVRFAFVPGVPVEINGRSSIPCSSEATCAGAGGMELRATWEFPNGKIDRVLSRCAGYGCKPPPIPGHRYFVQFLDIYTGKVLQEQVNRKMPISDRPFFIQKDERYTFQTLDGEMQFDFAGDTLFGMKDGIVWKRRISYLDGIIFRISSSQFNSYIGHQMMGVYHNRLFLVEGGEIETLDLKTGKTLWSRSIQDLIDPVWPVASDNIIAIGHKEGVVLLDINTGDIRAEFQMSVSGGPWRFIGEQNHLYFLTDGYSIVAFQK